MVRDYLNEGGKALVTGNKDAIGDNPNLIYPGQVLRIPPR